MTALQQLIAAYLRDKSERGEKENYSTIARRGGLEPSTVQALATRQYTRQGPRPETITKLAKGLEMDERRVREAVSISAGYGPMETGYDRPDIQYLLATVRDLDPERLEIVLRRARLLHEEMEEERRKAEERKRGRRP